MYPGHRYRLPKTAHCPVNPTPSVKWAEYVGGRPAALRETLCSVTETEEETCEIEIDSYEPGQGLDCDRILDEPQGRACLREVEGIPRYSNSRTGEAADSDERAAGLVDPQDKPKDEDKNAKKLRLALEAEVANKYGGDWMEMFDAISASGNPGKGTGMIDKDALGKFLNDDLEICGFFTCGFWCV